MIYKHLLKLVLVNNGYTDDSVFLNDNTFYLNLQDESLDSEHLRNLLNEYIEKNYESLIKRFGKKKGTIMLLLIDNETGSAIGIANWYNEKGQIN